MKDNRPIEMQVAELTPEQRKKLPKIYTTSVIAVVVPVIVLVLVVFGLFARGFELREEAVLHTEMIDMGVYDFTEYDEFYEKMDEADAMIETAFIVSGVGAVFLIVYVLIFNVAIYKRYPYYSEKRYFYLKKLKKAGYNVY